MSEEWIGIVSLALLFGAIFIGFPIAFTLMAIALGVGYLALGPIALHLMTIQFFAVMKETSLASVPFSCSWDSFWSSRGSWSACSAGSSSCSPM